MTEFSKQAIIQQFDSTEASPGFVFFWGPGEARLPKGCFNQWHPAKFEHKGFKFANAEQAMMADKAITFKDFEILEEILDCVEPYAVKALGRLVKNFSNPKWIEVRLAIVVEINYQKFSQNPEMLATLLATGDAILVEASPVDKIWGIGMKEGAPGILNPRNWKGLNLLGEALMIVRARLREEMNNNA